MLVITADTLSEEGCAYPHRLTNIRQIFAQSKSRNKIILIFQAVCHDSYLVGRSDTFFIIIKELFIYFFHYLYGFFILVVVPK